MIYLWVHDSLIIKWSKFHIFFKFNYTKCVTSTKLPLIGKRQTFPFEHSEKFTPKPETSGSIEPEAAGNFVLPKRLFCKKKIPKPENQPRVSRPYELKEKTSRCENPQKKVQTQQTHLRMSAREKLTGKYTFHSKG